MDYVQNLSEVKEAMFMNTNPPCHICGTSSAFFMSKDGFDEYLCPKCHLSFVFPQPSAQWLAEEIYSLESGYQRNKSSDLSRENEGLRFGRVLDYVAKTKPGGRFLDVGCSSGQVMYWARKRGLVPSGVEINKRTADIALANGFPVFNGFLENAPFEKKSFDVVFLGDVIEHVNNPREFISEVVSFLKPNGIIAISTPNVDCAWSHVTLWFSKVFNIPWTSATPPYHLFQFNHKTLSMLMDEFGMSTQKAFFLPPPSLRYELGSLHLLKRYKKEKTFGSALSMIFAFSVYILVYGVNFILHPILKKDFQMSVVYGGVSKLS